MIVGLDIPDDLVGVLVRAPDGTVVDSVGFGAGSPLYNEGLPAPADSATQAGLGLSRLPDGTDTGDNAADVGQACITPGAANVAVAANCRTPVLVINELDYAGQGPPATLLSCCLTERLRLMCRT